MNSDTYKGTDLTIVIGILKEEEHLQTTKNIILLTNE